MVIWHKICNIIKGTYYNITNKEQKVANQRLKICNKCNHKKYIGKVGICDQCGCILESKTRVKDEHCELGKW